MQSAFTAPRNLEKEEYSNEELEENRRGNSPNAVVRDVRYNSLNDTGP